MHEIQVDIRAEIRPPTQESRDDIGFFTGVAGMRMDMIHPADSPRVAGFSGHAPQLRLEQGAEEAPATIRVLTDDPDDLEAHDTTIARNTGDMAGVWLARRGAGEPVWARHDADILFGCVMAGAVTLPGDFATMMEGR